jgi:hypothetical protein
MQAFRSRLRKLTKLLEEEHRRVLVALLQTRGSSGGGGDRLSAVSTQNQIHFWMMKLSIKSATNFKVPMTSHDQPPYSPKHPCICFRSDAFLCLPLPVLRKDEDCCAPQDAPRLVHASEVLC